MPEGPTPPSRPLLVVLSGQSGAGKDALLRALVAQESDCVAVVTAKTRPPRPGEQHGVHQLFLSDAEFDALRDAGAFLEHAEVYGHRSGVPRDQVRAGLERGKIVLVRTDVQGARTLRAVVPSAVLIFVAAPDIETLERRLRGRNTDSEAAMRERLGAAQAEMDEAAWFDHVIVNREGAERAALQELQGIVRTERVRPDRPVPQV